MEWAHPTNKLLIMRARGRVFEPGKEEPGGVGGVEVLQRVEEMCWKGDIMPLRGIFFKKQFP